MADPQVVEELRQKIIRTEHLIRLAEAKMAVHHEKFDDQKKGRTCRNFTARMVFKKERDGYAEELATLKFRLPRDDEPGGEHLHLPPAVHGLGDHRDPILPVVRGEDRGRRCK